MKVAVTEVAALIVALHGPVPEHAPLQPVKFDVALGVAVRATVIPEVKLAEQEFPQAIPEGLLVTVPLPLPAPDTERVKVGGWITVTLLLTRFAT